MAEWNVVVYGTKELPESKNRAVSIATSTTTSTPLPTTVAMSSTTVTVRSEPTPLEQQPEWLDNGVDHSKSSVHQNNVEQNRGASDPVLPVLSSVAASAASAHCSPSHWDSAASVCLSTCLLIATHHLILSSWTQKTSQR